MRFSYLVLLPALVSGLQAQMPYGYEWMSALPSARVIERSAAAQPDAASIYTLQPWRLSLGYAARSFEADFRASSPSIGLIAPYLGGKGDVGFYRAGSGLLYYEDGYVGPGNGDGTARGVVTSGWETPDHVANSDWSPDDFIFVVGPGISRRSTKSFHTKMFGMPEREDFASGDAVGFGPYVTLSHTFVESSAGSIGLSVTWTGLHGQIDASSNFGHPQRTDLIYTYDEIYFIGPVPNQNIDAYGLVVDADIANDLYEQAFGNPGTFRNPRKATKNYTINEWTAKGRSSLDVRLNEIFLSADVAWKPWQGWEFGLSAGPTLNVVSTTLHSRTAWVRQDGLTVAGETGRENDTHVAVGAGVRAVARYDLTRDGRAYLETHAGYKWLNDLAIRGPTASADLDLSDWEIGLGVGIQLNDWPGGSPWSVRAGVDTRTLSFKTGSANEASLKSLFTRSAGRGDVGFFNGRDTIQYDDGFIIGRGSAGLPVPIVGPGGFNTFSMDHPSQADLEYDPGTAPGSVPQTDGHIHFRSTGIHSDFRRLSTSGRREEETAVSPYVELHRDIGGWGPLSAGFTWGWSGWSDHYSLDKSLSATATVWQTISTYQYSYPYRRYFERGALSATSFPYSDDSLVADPRYFDYGFPYTRSKAVSSRTSLVRYYALTSASIDVSMQTLSFAADVAWKPLRHLELAFSAGPTVNIVTTSTDLSTDWVREDGLLFARLHEHDNKTQLRFGFRLMASARYDLTSDGRWYAEARGGYEWMQRMDVGIGLPSASIDATSWQIGGGIGCRLGVRPRLLPIRDARLAQKPQVKPAPPASGLATRVLGHGHY